MLAVLGSVALDHLPLPVVPLDGERDGQDVVAGFDDLQDAPHPLVLLLVRLSAPQVLHQLVLHDLRPPVEEAFHHGEEVGVVLLVARRIRRGRGWLAGVTPALVQGSRAAQALYTALGNGRQGSGGPSGQQLA